MQAYLRLLAREAPLDELERIVVTLRKRAARVRVAAAEPLGQLCVLAWDGYMLRLQRSAQRCAASHVALSSAAVALSAPLPPPPEGSVVEAPVSGIAAINALVRAVVVFAPWAPPMPVTGVDMGAEEAATAAVAHTVARKMKGCTTRVLVAAAAHLQEAAAEVVRRSAKAAKLAKDAAWRETVDLQHASTTQLAHALARALAALAW